MHRNKGTWKFSYEDLNSWFGALLIILVKILPHVPGRLFSGLAKDVYGSPQVPDTVVAWLVQYWIAIRRTINSNSSMYREEKRTTRKGGLKLKPKTEMEIKKTSSSLRVTRSQKEDQTPEGMEMQNSSGVNGAITNLSHPECQVY